MRSANPALPSSMGRRICTFAIVLSMSTLGQTDYDLRHGRTYLYSKDELLYPFGFGLSYTNFSYRDMTVVQ